jgi:hypothetical protein
MALTVERRFNLDKPYPLAMKTDFNITLLLLLLFAYMAKVQAQNLDFEYIDMVHLDQKPIIAAKINGKKAFLLVDTGSDISLLDEGNADMFVFRIATGKDEIHSAESINGIKKNLRRVKFCTVALGSSEMKNTFFAMDLSKLVGLVRKKSHIKIHGIIGSDLMRKYDFTIDYHTHKVGFSNKHALLERPQEMYFSLYTLRSVGIDEVIKSHF